MLMDYHITYEEKNRIILQYTNNENDKLIYTTDPREELDYITDYESIRNDFLVNDTSIQNKIKKYIRLTEEEPDPITQIRYYVVTQNLIWKSFHPELNYEIQNDTINTYELQMQEKIELTPSFVKNYEIDQELKLKQIGNYKLSSNDCQITKEEDTWTIKNCSKTSTIKVEEEKEEDLMFYRKENQSIGIESGFSPCTWYFSINVKEIEEKPTDQEKEEENKKEPEKEEIKTPDKIEEENKTKEENKTIENKPVTNQENEWLEKHPIYNVPNTKEEKPAFEIGLFLLVGLCLRKNMQS